jgi:alpha-glucan,water dikinase
MNYQLCRFKCQLFNNTKQAGISAYKFRFYRKKMIKSERGNFIMLRRIQVTNLNPQKIFRSSRNDTSGNVKNFQGQYSGMHLFGPYLPHIGKEVYNMVMIEEITLKNRGKLLIEKREMEGHIEILLHLKIRENCLLHWGVSRKPGSTWHMPPEPAWPTGSRAHGRTAVRTPFACHNSDCSVSIRLDKTINYSTLAFAFFFPDTGRWDNNRGRNYHITLPVIKRQSPLPSVFKEDKKGRNILFEDTYPLGEDDVMAIAVSRDDNFYEVNLFSDVPAPLVFHWGMALQSRYEWTLPPSPLQPAGSVLYDDKAVQTPFVFSDGINRLSFRFSENEAPLGISFVLKIKGDDRWLKKRNGNFFIPVTYREEEKYPELSGLADEIIHRETGNHSWTLMHRFNLCYDLIDGVRTNAEGLSMIYVWMRFSAIRQLDWQRRFNTKPSELSHAQDRLK